MSHLCGDTRDNKSQKITEVAPANYPVLLSPLLKVVVVRKCWQPTVVSTVCRATWRARQGCVIFWVGRVDKVAVVGKIPENVQRNPGR